VKLLHIADIQLGAQFKILGTRADEQREQLKKTLHKALERGAKEGVSLVVVAGDFFDTNHPSHELVEFAKGEFGYLGEHNIQICIVPGHHDALDEHGIYNRERFDEEFENVFIFRDHGGEAKEYPSLDVAVLAKPNTASTSTQSPFPRLAGSDPVGSSKMKYRVIAAHGDLQIPGKSAKNYHPITNAELESLSDINYVALGHWHSMRDCTSYGNFKMPVWYSGSPELVASDQTGSGNILLVELIDGGSTVKTVSIGKRISHVMSLDISNFQSMEQLKKKILESANKNVILQVELSGLNTNNILIDTEQLANDLTSSFFFVRVTDKTHFVLSNIPEYPEKLIQGQFMKIMKKKIRNAPEGEKKVYEEALQVGLAELEGKEIV